MMVLFVYFPLIGKIVTSFLQSGNEEKWKIELRQYCVPGPGERDVVFMCASSLCVCAVCWGDKCIR